MYNLQPKSKPKLLNSFINVAILFALCLIAQWFFPWWISIIVCAAYAFLKENISFGKGFIAVFLLWLFTSLYIHFASNGVLTTKIAELFHIPNNFWIIQITALIGGIAGGLGALSGKNLRLILKHKPLKTLYK